MQTRTDKRDRASLFRSRLRQAMTNAEISQSALARTVGVDRSTLSQLLRDAGARLPGAQLVADCAQALGVSADWLLGLSDRPEQASDLLASAMAITHAPRALIDDQIFGWHQEAAGYKIRHVPANLPDMLKTHDMLRWEYAPSLGRTIEQAIGASQDRLNWMRQGGSDYEIAISQTEVDSFARAEGYYTGLSAQVRGAQIDHILALHDQLYPNLRLHLFDPKRLFSAPLTVFGPLLAVLYLGQNYLAFRDSDRVGALSRHVDRLVRDATVPPRDLPAYLRQLRRDL